MDVIDENEMESIHERIFLQYGKDCFNRLDPNVAVENQFRVSALWTSLTQMLQVKPPVVLATSVRSIRAFPHTLKRKKCAVVIMDQHLVDLFGLLTLPIVVNCKDIRVLATLFKIYAERLRLTHRDYDADVYHSLYFHTMRQVGELSHFPRQWHQGELLCRGQWLFTIGHELVHGIILSEPSLERGLDEWLESMRPDLEDEVERIASGGSNDDGLRNSELQRIYATIGVQNLTNRQQVSQILPTAIKEKMDNAGFRQEVICDWHAASITSAEMAHWCSVPTSHAACGLALIQLGVLEHLDDNTRGESNSRRHKLRDKIMRFIILRVLLELTSDASQQGLIARAFGDIASAYVDTYEDALFNDWSIPGQSYVDRLGLVRRQP